MMESNILFTPAAVMNLLCQIDELKDLEVSVYDGDPMKIQIGNTVYQIDSDPTDIPTDQSVIDEVNEVNDEGYDESVDIDTEPVTSGILKELGKTLLIGGLLRLTAKALR